MLIIGFGTTVGPLYITEIAPLRFRGSLGACFQLFVAIAVLIAQILGLDLYLGQEHFWHYLFGLLGFLVLLFDGSFSIIGVPLVFSLLQCVLLSFTHETPEFLLQKKRYRAAERGFHSSDSPFFYNTRIF